VLPGSDVLGTFGGQVSSPDLDGIAITAVVDAASDTAADITS